MHPSWFRIYISWCESSTLPGLQTIFVTNETSKNKGFRIIARELTMKHLCWSLDSTKVSVAEIQKCKWGDFSCLTYPQWREDSISGVALHIRSLVSTMKQPNKDRTANSLRRLFDASVIKEFVYFETAVLVQPKSLQPVGKSSWGWQRSSGW